MATHINNLNIQVPFPPSTSADEIVQFQIQNGIKNANQTMNAFLIYRREFNHTVKNHNLELKVISSLAGIYWKQEPKHIKKHYKQLAKKVKELFKEKVPSLCFVDCNHVNHVGTGTNINHKPIPNMDLDYDRLILNMDYNYLCECLAMDENEFMDHLYHLSDDLALTYREIMQSLPF